MESLSSKKFLQTFLWSSILLSGLAAVQTVQRVDELEILLWRSKWVFLLAIFLLNIAVGALLLRQAYLERITSWLDAIAFDPSNNLKKVLGIALLISGFLLIWGIRLFFCQYRPYLQHPNYNS